MVIVHCSFLCFMISLDNKSFEAETFARGAQNTGIIPVLLLLCGFEVIWLRKDALLLQYVQFCCW